MSKYFWRDQGKIKDWRWVWQEDRWLLYLDETYIGTIYKHGKSDYSASGSSTPFPFPVRGFRTRLDAALFILTWRNYKLKQGQWDMSAFSDVEKIS